MQNDAATNDTGLHCGSARNEKNSATPIHASAVICGPSPYRTSTFSLYGIHQGASSRMLWMNKYEGEISATAAAASRPEPRHFDAPRTNKYTPAMPKQ